ncbi:MAG: nucleotidyltransferase family protein [Chloroflexota bacterium]|nr:nucleotidyltransferase family protein [Chloroflexota bacterium]
MKEKDIRRFREALELQLSLLAEHYQVQSLGIFGSYVRREQHSNSDLDVLVSFSETPSLLKFIALENYLSDLLGVKVDLVMQDALKPNIGQHILREVIHV